MSRTHKNNESKALGARVCGQGAAGDPLVPLHSSSGSGIFWCGKRGSTGPVPASTLGAYFLWALLVAIGSSAFTKDGGGGANGARQVLSLRRTDGGGGEAGKMREYVTICGCLRTIYPAPFTHEHTHLKMMSATCYLVRPPSHAPVVWDKQCSQVSPENLNQCIPPVVPTGTLQTEAGPRCRQQQWHAGSVYFRGAHRALCTHCAKRRLFFGPVISRWPRPLRKLRFSHTQRSKKSDNVSNQTMFHTAKGEIAV